MNNINKYEIKDIYDSDIIFKINEKLSSIINFSLEQKTKIILSFEDISMTEHFINELANIINKNPKFFNYIDFQKLNKIYKKILFSKIKNV